MTRTLTPRLPKIELVAENLEGRKGSGIVLDPDELAIRLLESATGKPRPPGQTAAELVNGYADPELLPYGRAAEVAVCYLAELLVKMENATRRKREAARKAAAQPPALLAKPPTGLH